MSRDDAGTGPADERRFTIGVDIGGTFTDCVVVDDRRRIVGGKVPTTPHDRSEGFFGSIARAAQNLGISDQDLISRSRLIVHGTTTGTNAIVSRTGAAVGLLATIGHEDVMHLMVGRGRTSGLPADELLDLPRTRKPDPIVPKTMVAAIEERTDVDGDEIYPLDADQVAEAVRSLVDGGAESLAISLLWSIKKPSVERRVREIAERVAPDTFVCCGTDLMLRIGEYERTTSAVMNAYIGPLMVRYIDAIEVGLQQRGFSGRALFAQCAGGAITGAEARSAPIRTVDSGPVAGVNSSRLLAAHLGEPNVIATDMGGTTFDVSVIHEGMPLEREISVLQRYELALPMVDIESVGAGGGSIAWIDDAGRLNVGPRSAGADPGPACYGRGGEAATVTDADVVLGLIRPETFLHGRMQLDRELAERAVGRIAAQIGLSTPAAAAGINRIVDAKMADLIRRMSLMRGFDPRNFVCFAYGGGGPVHAAAVAREAGIDRIVVPIPRIGALFSALGAAAADVTHQYQHAELMKMPVEGERLERIFGELEARAEMRLSEDNLTDLPTSTRRSVRMKYAMQVHDIEVGIPSDLELDAAGVGVLESEFERTYESLFGAGSGYRAGGIELTSVTLRTTAEMPELTFAEDDTPKGIARSSRPVYWSTAGDFIETEVLSIESGSLPGETFAGPFLFEFPDTVVVVPPGMSARFDEDSNVVIEAGRQS